ncbi:MAG: caspase family protein [Xanthobacteraceae bacterium]
MSNGLAKVEVTLSDTLIAYAAKAGSTADDGNGANSPFTAALLAHIPEPGVDVRIVFGRVRDEVWTRTGHRQEPFVYASLGGAEVPLVPAARKVEPPAPAGEIEARQAYELTVKLGTRQALEAFLEDYKTGLYADLARAELGKLPAVSTEQPRKPAADPHPAKQPAATAERTDDASAAPRKPAGPTQTHHRRSVETRHGAPAEHHRRSVSPVSPAISRPAPQAPRC